MKEDPTALADAIERGRALHPEWDVAVGTYFRNAKGHEVLSTRGSPTVAAACVMGFALAGGHPVWFGYLDGPCPAGDDLCIGPPLSLSHLNDLHRWSPERIVAWLREQA